VKKRRKEENKINNVNEYLMSPPCSQKYAISAYNSSPEGEGKI